MIICFCAKCVPILDSWHERICATFFTLCEIYAAKGCKPFPMQGVSQDTRFSNCLEYLELRGSIVSHETNDYIYLKPRYVYKAEDVGMPVQDARLMFCVEGGHVPFAKEY